MGRAQGGGQSSSPGSFSEREGSALRAKAAAVLFDRMVGDPSAYVQWACFHALARTGGPWMGEQAVKLLRSPNPDHIARAIHLCGDWKVAAAAKTLGAGIFSIKDDLLRRRCGVEFWRVADRDAVEEFTAKMREAKGGLPFARGCDALGSWRNPTAFKLALDLLRSTRDGSPEQFCVELCLEKMTGHFFGPYPGIWNKWFEKNPEFFTPKQARIEREKWRADFDKENKGFRQTKDTEKSVQMGLEYLARHQDQDGAWDPQGFRSRCDLSPTCSASTGTRVQEDPSGRTGIAVLAFLGAGYSPESGKFKTAIRRGLEYLMARQQVHGDYLTNDLIGGYNRPIALQAYAEGYAVTHDERFLPFVRRGVDFLTQIQNSIGGWRYRVEVQTSDSSVAAWMLFAMKAAEKAGVEVRPVVYEGCRMLFERYSVRVPKDGPREDFVDIDPSYGFEVGKDTTYEFRTGYQDQAYAPTHATTALGLMSHILLGFRRSHPFCIGSANHIVAKQMPEAPKDGDWGKVNIKQEYPIYFFYYGTLAMHQMGGRYFRKWNEQVRTLLPETQVKEGCSRGAWIGKNLDGIFGSIYTTATGVMTLETYYRYLPVLQD
ncbi:MAG: terpene cyclase/mutase family protein [Planctomycetaceae bacterium]|nr:terpene cyclase/mutase family protein [Planctomycetaceae bacterium]